MRAQLIRDMIQFNDLAISGAIVEIEDDGDGTFKVLSLKNKLMKEGFFYLHPTDFIFLDQKESPYPREITIPTGCKKIIIEETKVIMVFE